MKLANHTSLDREIRGNVVEEPTFHSPTPSVAGQKYRSFFTAST
jgi:1,6-anhydro-N-acetylmuramate kinase